MELYKTTPKVVRWEGGYGQSFVVRRKDSEEKLFLSIVDEWVLCEPEPECYRSYDKKFIKIPKGLSIIEKGEIKILLKTDYISNSGLTGIVHLFTTVDVELQKIPFYRIDWKEKKNSYFIEPLVNRFFIKTVPEYISLYNRTSRKLCFVKLYPFKKFTYVNGSGEEKEGLMYLTKNIFVPTMYFRLIPENENVYAVKLSEKNYNDKHFWRIKMDNIDYNIFSSIDELKELIKEKKLQKIV